MPPRTSSVLSGNTLDLTSLLRALPSTKNPDLLTKCTRCLSTTSTQLSKQTGRTRPVARKDPYRIAQAAQRKTANLEKRRVLAAEREAAMGDPVRSKPTPFLASLNLSKDTLPPGTDYLNYQLDPKAKSEQLSHSKWLTEPLARASSSINQFEKEQQSKRVEQHRKEHGNAVRAIDTIVSLQNASQKDKTRINVQRCIETFGRHNTDLHLPPKPASLGPTRPAAKLDDDATPTPEQTRQAELMAELQAIPKRAGPDTGSSECQIAVLTLKINVLSNNLSHKDKVNKRNLRLLVHRRQKLLKYLYRKERGGPRWQNLMEQLGGQPAWYQGEISL